MTASGTDETETQRSIVAPLGDQLTNSETVLALLAEHGGTLTQQDLLEHTDWSSSKMSDVLATLETEEKVLKIEYGPSHIVILPSVVPDIME